MHFARPSNIPSQYRQYSNTTLNMTEAPTTTTTTPNRLPIRTQHCAFCSHLLLATTRPLTTLPRRSPGALDKALILPLDHDPRPDADPEQDLTHDLDSDNTRPPTKTGTKHTTLLLSTTIPDRRATLIRREDGIEKRILLRCGRCRVVVGYFLDQVHWASTRPGRQPQATEVVEGEGKGEEEKPPAVYVLPGAVVETGSMGDVGGGGREGEEEWRGWGDNLGLA